jgi:N-dimethylarginine dimethylaminohydrolase
MITTPTKPRFLMCRPDYFGVRYAINPWMDPNSWARADRVLTAASHRQWAALRDQLRQLGAAIELVPPAPAVPDLVFTANSAVVLDRKVLLARFRHPERQAEEAHFETAFESLQRRGVVDGITSLPDHLVLEGAGDCVWDDWRQLFWTGYGPRSDAAASEVVKDTFGVDVVPLELADPRFYHLDTALCPLPQGEVMFVPSAFTRQGRAAIDDRVARAQRVEVDEEDACQLAANAVAIGNTLVMSRCGERLNANLTERGYRVVTTPLDSFLRSGGAAFCLTLRLDRMSGHRGQDAARARASQRVAAAQLVA